MGAEFSMFSGRTAAQIHGKRAKQGEESGEESEMEMEFAAKVGAFDVDVGNRISAAGAGEDRGFRPRLEREARGSSKKWLTFNFVYFKNQTLGGKIFNPKSICQPKLILFKKLII